MLAALGLDAVRRQIRELWPALVGIALAGVGVVAPWIDDPSGAVLGFLRDEGKFALLVLIAAAIAIWRYANGGRPGDLFGLLLAGGVSLLVAVAELVQLDDGSGNQADSPIGWGLWLYLIGACTLTLGAIVAAQLRANRTR